MALQKSVDLLLAFGFEDRAGGINHPTTGLEQRPQRVQQLALDGGQRDQVFGPAQPANVGMAAHDARSRARRIEQDRIEQPAVPPSRDLPGIRRLQRHLAARRGQVQTGQCVPNPIQAADVAVEREQVQISQFQQLRSLAAGRSAGVQHARACRQGPRLLGHAQQQRYGLLGRQVLHRDVAISESGQIQNRARLAQHQRLGADQEVCRLRRSMAQRSQALRISRRAGTSCVDPQRHRRVTVGSGQQRLPMGGPVLPQPLYPPQWMVVQRRRRALRLGHQRAALAQKPPQHRVDEIGGGRRSSPGCRDGLVDQGVLGIGRWFIPRPQQRQRDDQQRRHRRWRRLGRHQRQHGLGAAQRSQGLETQRLGPTAQFSRHPAQQVSERAPRPHR